MATAQTPKIAVVVRTYQGIEGNRVKAGTRFAVGQDQGGLPVISKARYEQLRQSKIIRALTDEDLREAPRSARPLARKAVVETSMVGRGSPSAAAIRQGHRNRTKQPDAPAAPKQVAGPLTGSQTGEAASPSSSAGAPAPKASITRASGKRGTRGSPAAAPASPSASSPSTTPTR